ncbi:protein dopey homolog PFC0245c-like [Pieris brassicae]|uniref:protein dopey homolog PFC0245c-like n=1 Tax=Pieris brassicae TaxID=7116 RepID=UPI001E660099|nr:protein dopey homolog PFC0245c-like [Pieris brassicae]
MYGHQVLTARRSRSYPLHTGYHYRRSNSEPRVASVFNSNDYSAILPRSKFQTSEYLTNCNDFKIKIDGSSKIYYDNDIGYEKAKVKCNVNSDILTLKPTLSYEENRRFNRNSDYHVDDDDVRTDTNMYDSWPYSYRNRYDYNLNYDPENEKAKDKRYVNDIIERIIPVHEDHQDDVHEKEREKEDVNPMYGNQAFFSHILEDYFDRTNEEDPLLFKGLNYNKGFDTVPYKDIYGSNKRFRRLKTYDTHKMPYVYNSIRDKVKYNDEDKLSEIGEEYNKIGDANDKSTKDAINESDKTAYNYDGQNYRGFKDFIDSFVNKFGTADHKKNVDFSINKTVDKGEKKKGFRRVYHKDEYQEDNEFYDNSNNKAVMTENGGSKLNNGGSEAILASQASAVLGDEANDINKLGNKVFAKSRHSESISAGRDGPNLGLQKFKQVAKSNAWQNNADYYDHL